jgi:hypothetical protein
VDAVGRDGVLGVGNEGRKTGWGDGAAFGFGVRESEVEAEEEGQRVFALFHAFEPV